MRVYKSTNLREVSPRHTGLSLKQTIHIQNKCAQQLKNLSIYVQNLPAGYMLSGERINNEPTNNAKTRLADYSNTPQWITKIIPMSSHDHWDGVFAEMCVDLDVIPALLLKFLLTDKTDAFASLSQVIGEQDRFIESDMSSDTYYLEIFIGNQRIISMFVHDLPSISAQTHFFIVNDLKYLIDDNRQLPNSSLFMHSFASSLFGNSAWYTNPIGSMKDILESKLKSTSYETTGAIERKTITSVINKKYYLGTTNSVEPAYKYHIGSYMRNLWKTQTVLRPANEQDKERLGDMYTPDYSAHANVVLYRFTYDKKVGGYNALVSCIHMYVLLIVLIIIIYYLYEQFTSVIQSWYVRNELTLPRH